MDGPQKLNALLRKLTKCTLGLPISTPNKKLAQLGIHNTMEEIAEAQTQLARLNKTRAGRKMLAAIGLDPNRMREPEEAEVGLNREQRDAIRTTPLPRNMHPVHKVNRRKANPSLKKSRAWEHRRRSLTRPGSEVEKHTRQ